MEDGPLPAAMSAGLDDVVIVDGAVLLDESVTPSHGFAEQFRAGIARLEGALKAKQSSLSQVLRAEIRITENGPDTYNALQEAFLNGFSAVPRPARCVSAVPSLPHESLVEIGCVAIGGSGQAKSPLSAIIAPDGPAPCAPFPHARVYRNGVWATAQVGSDPKTGSLAPVSGGTAAQMRHSINNLSAILRAAGASLETVVHARVQYVSDEEHGLLADMVAGEPWPIGQVELNLVPFIPTAQTGVTVKVDAVARCPGA